jgi:hypothetical protein
LRDPVDLGGSLCQAPGSRTSARAAYDTEAAACGTRRAHSWPVAAAPRPRSALGVLYEAARSEAVDQAAAFDRYAAELTRFPCLDGDSAGLGWGVLEGAAQVDQDHPVGRRLRNAPNPMTESARSPATRAPSEQSKRTARPADALRAPRYHRHPSCQPQVHRPPPAAIQPGVISPARGEDTQGPGTCSAVSSRAIPLPSCHIRPAGSKCSRAIRRTY